MESIYLQPQRFEEYKSKETFNQIKRREEFLKRQKQKRNELTEYARKLIIEHTEEQNENMQNIEENNGQKNQNNNMEISKISKNEEKRINFYKNQLMLHEDLFEIPKDLLEEWLVVPYLEGERCLVIASKGITSSRKINGTLINKFISKLPGGSKLEPPGTRGSFTILDCIYCSQISTYFVLDIMAWKGCLYYDCPTDFRIYWKLSKLEEINSKEISFKNPFAFIPLPFYECNHLGISTAMEISFPVIKKGILFYHKQTHYTIGNTPLVCYLPLHLVIPTLSNIFNFNMMIV